MPRSAAYERRCLSAPESLDQKYSLSQFCGGSIIRRSGRIVAGRLPARRAMGTREVIGTLERDQSVGFLMAQAAAARKPSSPTPTFASFEEFWPYYLRAHSKPETRAMHLAGTTAGLLGVAAWLATGRAKYLAAGLVGSYGSAWIGHFAFEGNTPATFDNPVWSLQADFRMYRLWLEGRLEAEMQRVLTETDQFQGGPGHDGA
jgi:hypothetical protein